jgi:phage shock protein PspC (stress-responsive transcriptional regulator)
MSSSTSYQLTPSQHELVTRFLKKSAYHWRLLDSKARAQSMHQLKKAIHDRLETVYNADMTDSDFARILESFDVKSSGWFDFNWAGDSVIVPVEPDPIQAPAMEENAEETLPVDVEVVDVEVDDDAVVLGVCDSWADQFNASPNQIRALWALFGMITGPFAVTAYLLGYGERVLTRRIPSPQRSALDWQGMFYIAAGISIWFATLVFQKGIYVLGGTFTDSVLVMGQWDWLQYSGNTASFWILFSLLSLSLLLTLPSQPRSKSWIQNSARAILFVYGIFMAYGMGRLLTGFLLRTTEL